MTNRPLTAPSPARRRDDGMPLRRELRDMTQVRPNTQPKARRLFMMSSRPTSKSSPSPNQ